MTQKKVERFGPWSRLDRRLAYENSWINVYHDEVIDPGGEPGVYGVVSFKHRAIGVLAIDDAENLLTVSQYRYPLKKVSLEIPEGGASPGEDPLEAAKRELREETGYVASQWKLLLEMDLSNSVTDDSALIFLATGLSDTGMSSLETTESDLSLSKHSLLAMKRLIAAGEITDAITVAAVLAYEGLHLSVE